MSERRYHPTPEELAFTVAFHQFVMEQVNQMFPTIPEANRKGALVLSEAPMLALLMAGIVASVRHPEWAQRWAAGLKQAGIQGIADGLVEDIPVSVLDDASKLLHFRRPE